MNRPSANLPDRHQSVYVLVACAVSTALIIAACATPSTNNHLDIEPKRNVQQSGLARDDPEPTLTTEPEPLPPLIDLSDVSEGCKPSLNWATGMARIEGIVAQETTDMRAIRQWLSDRAKRPGKVLEPVRGLEHLDDDEIVSVCVYGGTGFVTPRPEGARGPNTSIFFVLPHDVPSDGDIRYGVGPVIFFQAGQHDSMEPLTPSRSDDN